MVVHDAEYPAIEEDGRLAERVHPADLVQAEVAAVRDVRDSNEARVAGTPRVPRHIDGDRGSRLRRGRGCWCGVRSDVRQERVVRDVQRVQREHRREPLRRDRAELERQQLAALVGIEQPAPVRAGRARQQRVHVHLGEVRWGEHRQVQCEAVGRRGRRAGAFTLG